jgi:hypothetical protein
MEIEIAMDILAGHADHAPDPQKTADIFNGEWISSLPGIASGKALLFTDRNATWAHEKLNFSGKRVLEFGPLEGAHTYMIHGFGAKEIIGVEASAQCYMKCLIVKELYNLNRSRFLYGDIIAFLAETDQRFDIIFASGVLYHSREPLRLLELIAEHADSCFLWTHYFDADHLEAGMGEKFRQRFPNEEVPLSHAGYSCAGHPFYYDYPHWKGFPGGTAPSSIWLKQSDILGFLRHSGFLNIEIQLDITLGPAGPFFSLAAQK